MHSRLAALLAVVAVLGTMPIARGDGRPRPWDVAVVGAGPVGLSFALDLARKGYRVTVFEGRSRGNPVNRASDRGPNVQRAPWGVRPQQLVWSQKGLQNLYGLDRGVNRIVHWVDQMHGFDGTRRTRETYGPEHRSIGTGTADVREVSRSPSVATIGVSDLERHLARALEAAGGRIQFDARVTGVEESGGRVRLTEPEGGSRADREGYDLVYVADGGGLREALGATLVERDHVPAMNGLIRAPQGFPATNRNVWTTVQTRGPDGVVRGLRVAAQYVPGKIAIFAERSPGQSFATASERNRFLVQQATRAGFALPSGRKQWLSPAQQFDSTAARASQLVAGPGGRVWMGGDAAAKFPVHTGAGAQIGVAGALMASRRVDQLRAVEARLVASGTAREAVDRSPAWRDVVRGHETQLRGQLDRALDRIVGRTVSAAVPDRREARLFKREVLSATSSRLRPTTDTSRLVGGAPGTLRGGASSGLDASRARLAGPIGGSAFSRSFATGTRPYTNRPGR